MGETLHALGERIGQLQMGQEGAESRMLEGAHIVFIRSRILALQQHLLKHRLRQPRRQATHRQS